MEWEVPSCQKGKEVSICKCSNNLSHRPNDNFSYIQMTWETEDNYVHDLCTSHNTCKFQLSDLLNGAIQLCLMAFSEIMFVKVLWKS